MPFPFTLTVMTSLFLFIACSEAPSPKELCNHVAKISEEDDTPDRLKKCIDDLKQMKTVLGDAKFRTMGACVMKATDKEGAGTCAMQAMSKGPAADYIAKSKTSEANQFLRKMYDGARAYYLEPGMVGMDMAPVAAQFPAPSVGPTPALGACCKNGGKCAPDSAAWDDQTWRALMFSVDDPHYYSYEYKVKQDETGAEFTVLAYGDLDCDGVYSTFKMTGIASPDGEGPAGSHELERINEME